MINARSLVNKLSEFELFITSHSYPAVVAVTETFFVAKLTDTIVCPSGYTVFRKDRNGPGGGVALFVRSDLAASSVDESTEQSFSSTVELVAVDINFCDRKIRIINCYRPPYYNDADVGYLTHLITSLTDLLNIDYDVILLGDFNLPEIDWTNYHSSQFKCYEQFLLFINDHGLHQYVLEPTRGDNILDLVLCNNPAIIADLSVLCPFSTSDHNVVSFCICVSPTAPTVDTLYYDFCNANFDKLNEYLSNINWDYEFSFVFHAEDYWCIFLYYLHQAIDLFVPKKFIAKLKVRKTYPKYIKQMFTRKAVMWKRWKTTHIIEHKQAYIAYSAKCKRTLENYYRANELKLIDSNDLGRFYRYVNKKFSKGHEVSHIIDKMNGNTLTSDDSRKANIFGEYFGSVFTKDDGSLPEIKSRIEESVKLDSVDFSIDKVYKTLRRLKPSTSCGPDGLPNVILKNLACSISAPLSYIFNSSFSSHYLPSQWLQAYVTPVFKKGSMSDPTNYRPISLTCTCCKVMERIINDQLLDYLSAHSLITNSQYGFLRKRSTCTNLLECINDWTLALDKHQTTDIAYIDFQKAFDSVSHPKLLQKLNAYNITGDLHGWITAFLANRSQCVKISTSFSTSIPVYSGVPQGSVLGPTLFLLYINDLVDCFNDVNCIVKLYADDVKLYSSFTLSDRSVDLDIALQRLVEWANTWQLPIAFKKCVVHRLCTRRDMFTALPDYKLGNYSLTWSDQTRDIGVIIDNSLKFDKHIASVVHTASSRAYLILKSFVTRDQHILVKAFITYVRPLLEYCTPVWSPHLKKFIRMIENVQRRFTKRIEGLYHLSYPARLQQLGLEALQERRLKFDLIMCYKIMYNFVEVNTSAFFCLHTDDRTRGHTAKLVKPACNLNIRKYCFCSRVVDAWNKLPQHVVNVTSVNSFKSALSRLDFTALCDSLD